VAGAVRPRHLAVRALRALRIFVHLLGGVATTTLVFPAAGRGRRTALTRGWSAALLRMAGIGWEVKGDLPAHGNVLVVANHVSWLDIVVLNAVCPMRFVSKAEVARWPLAGSLVRGAGTLFIERSRPRDTHRVTERIRAALAAGDIVAVFPEGTTSAGATLLPFKSSLLQAAVDAGARVVPVALRYRQRDGRPATALAYTGDDTFLHSFWRMCAARDVTVEVHALPPLPTPGSDRRALARAAEAAIASALELPAQHGQ
jgi:1-acyl-sn-glycerol-3-phosphate acyltransferase